MKPLSALWRFALSATAALVLFIVLANVMLQPVDSETRSYTADFTDAAGLRLDADVRVRGVRVGKVTSVELERKDGQSLAAVGFTLDKRYAVTSDTRLAIKYQALTGLRYVDVVNPSESDPNAAVVSRIPTAMTQPSLDITTLFNGLQPVFVTLSPEEIDRFTANTAAYLSGDGRGLGPMLDSMRELTAFVSDRQQVVATLMQNLTALAGEMGGHSKDFVQVLDWLNRPLDQVLSILDEFRKSDLYGAGFTAPIVRLLHNVGVKKGIDIDAALDKAFTNLDNAVQAFKMVPVMWENIGPPMPDGEPEPCSRGRAQLPATMDVLLNGQRVVLCNQ
jgi:phospholipid/cholesterol/gamma-HCH transport system substrate-binding protein